MVINGTSGITFPDGSLQGIGVGRRNLIINGAMQVNQRGDVSASGSGGYYCCDRYSIRQSGGYLNSLTFDVTQETGGPNGFKNYYQLKTLAGDTPSGDETGSVRYVVEDKDIENFGFGTSDAKAFTLSFWVKASVAGTYSVGFVASGGDYSYVAEYTISSADTWEYISISVPAPTSGTWSSSGAGMQIHWNVAGASGGAYGTTSGSWVAADKRYSNNQVNNTATANNTFNFTGVQLEVGTVATPFEHRSYGEELALCQRYFQKSSRSGFLLGRGNGSTNVADVPVNLSTPMRATPTGAVTTGNWYAIGSSFYTSGTGAAFQQIDTTSDSHLTIGIANLSGIIDNRITGVSFYSGYTLDAEL